MIKRRHAHARFIESLGDTAVVHALVEARGRVKLTSEAVSMWKLRGIPPKWQPLLATLAHEKHVADPRDFPTIQKGH